jgi:hypothetical protein
LVSHRHPGARDRFGEGFEDVWQAIDDISVRLLMPSLPAGVELVEIPEDQRDSSRTAPGLDPRAA